MSALWPFMLFAFVASITPGPTNILLLNTSSRYGFLRTLPSIFGACAAAALIVLLLGMGVGASLADYPRLMHAMSWAGVAWLSYLAWQIFRSPATPIEPVATAVNSTTVASPNEPHLATSPAATAAKPARLGLIGAAGLQVVNPKTWTMALAVATVFGGVDVGHASRVMVLALTFFLIALPCLSVWAMLGIASKRWLRSPHHLQRFNQGMALLLLGSAWLALWQ